MDAPEGAQSATRADRDFDRRSASSAAPSFASARTVGKQKPCCWLRGQSMCIRPFRGTLIRLKAADLPIRERDFKKSQNDKMIRVNASYGHVGEWFFVEHLPALWIWDCDRSIHQVFSDQIRANRLKRINVCVCV